MNKYDLSILIPARNEEFLINTVEDILKNKRAATEVIVVLDGEWSVPPLKQHDDLNVIYVSKSIGQRASINMACRLSKAKYVMKIDAHCSVEKGFDRKMLEAFKEVGDNVVMAPTMKNLHCFNWACECGFRHYQDKGETCPECGKQMKKEIIWFAKRGPNSTSFCFDSQPHFQYFNEYKGRQEGDLVESMSLQGSCFMMTREKFWELNVCDESFGSWGSQGIEVACKFWLSGGRVLVNKRTWYAHMFRTKAAVGFGFPYKQNESNIQAAKAKAKDLFFNNKWEKQVKPISWLVDKFWPVPGWDEKDLQELHTRDGVLGEL